MSGKLSQEERDTLNRIDENTRSMFGGAGNGSKVYGGTDEHTGLSYAVLVIREDATDFTSLVCTDGVTAKGKGDFYVGGATSIKGDQLVAPLGYRFTSFELSAGSVAAA
jgi:hypothetical protein